jgi:predicted DNA-binding transcriptional regulator YafY
VIYLPLSAGSHPFLPALAFETCEQVVNKLFLQSVDLDSLCPGAGATICAMKNRTQTSWPVTREARAEAGSGCRQDEAREFCFTRREEGSSGTPADPAPSCPKAKRSRRARLERYSRPPWERMLKIHQRIQAGGWPNCVGMATELEVSLRTLKRDVEFMRDRLGLPIEYDRQRHGLYFAKPAEPFPGLGLTDAERLALLVARKAVVGTPFARSLETAFRRLTERCDGLERPPLQCWQDGLSFRPQAPEEADPRTFQIVTEALQARRMLRFRYRNLGTLDVQMRLAQPYHLASIDNHWYLFAFDVDRQAVRTFALARLTRPELTPERFSRPKDFDPDEYLRGSFTVLKGQEDFEVVIQFDAWATDLVRHRHWHASQRFLELPGAGSQLRLRLSSLAEIEG